MDFIDLAKQRFSVRSYTSQKVEKEKLNLILEAGRVAPTGANKQPHRLIVVQEKQGLDKISKAADVYSAPLVVIVCADMNQAWVRPFDKKNIADIDTTIVTTHMMLQATELGLGSVWICYFKPDVIREGFNLPLDFEPIHILALGYPNEPAKSPERHNKLRKSIGNFVYFETIG